MNENPHSNLNPTFSNLPKSTPMAGAIRYSLNVKDEFRWECDVKYFQEAILNSYEPTIV